MAAFTTDGIAFITGAAHGIGRGAALALAEAGASVIFFADIDGEGAQKSAEASRSLASNTNYRCKAIELDVTDFDAVDKTIRAAASEFGRLDYLINSAGVDVDKYSPLPDIELGDFDRVQRVNVKGILHCSKVAIAIMEKQEARTFTTRQGNSRSLGRGAIINVTSVASYAAVASKVAYVTSKHAAIGLTKATAMDTASKQIRVNAVCPSWVRTPMYTAECKKAPPVEAFIKAAVPSGRPAEPEEVGDSIVYLCSPAASYTNGIGLILDAGLTLTVHLG